MTDEDKSVRVEKEAADDLPHEKSPRKNEKPPGPEHVYINREVDDDLREDDDVSDTGGGVYRPRSRRQDPAADPFEPWTGAGPNDSAAKGYEHGWNGCLMTAGGIGLDYHTAGKERRWGGELRHRQTDMSGGTDLLDLKTAWAKLGYTLNNRTGQGWAGVRESLDAQKRGVMLQGTGNTPGAGTYTGAHAIYVNPETRRDSAGNLERLIVDPLVAGWQWVNDSALKTWAQRLNSNVQFAVTRSRL